MCDFSAYAGASEEWQAVAKTLAPGQPDHPVEEAKRVQNEARDKLAAEGFALMRSKVITHDHTIPCRDGSHIEGRTYRPATSGESQVLPVYIHFHGGGFMTGTLSSEDAICAGIAIDAGVMVLNVNYRHTPDHHYPTAWNDAEDAFGWLHDHIDTLCGDPKAVVVGGISAGAWLTASLVLQQRLGQAITSSRPPVAGQVLMIPCLVHYDCYEKQRQKLRDPSYSSLEQNHDAPILPMPRAKLFISLLQVENADPTDLRLNPGNADPSQIAGLPPTVFGVAGTDILRDEGLLYAKMLAENGVPTVVDVFKGVPHGFRRYGQLMPTTAARWDKVMADGIGWALSNPEASGRFDIRED